MSVKTDKGAAVIRCAIYTRKSSEEGLDQAFNSLHAQREACEAYVLSQAGEGWTALPDLYDDGGYSGGTLERPALHRLLADISAGRVDTVVVYKIDRLTRSLMDFSKIVERLEAAGASFVSVTQAFNTTTSMGRLTLNVLLSFAQFEREVTGERIRDKIAASKAKGMWMGGMLPLGYDLHDRKLIQNEAEADTVRLIFHRYLELGSVNALRDVLEATGVRSKAWVSRGGRAMGGSVIGRGALFDILQNRLYLGEIRHRAEHFPGQHQAILDRELFDAVQDLVGANRVMASRRRTRAATMALRGKVFDASGEAMSPSFSYGRHRRLYRYYISMSLQVGGRPLGRNGIIQRVGADGLERFITRQVQRITGRHDLPLSEATDMVRRIELGREDTHIVLNADALFDSLHWRIAFEDLQARLEVGERAVWEDGDRSAIRLVLPLRMQLRGGRTWFNGGVGKATCATINPGLVGALRSAHAELVELKASPLISPSEFAQAKAPSGPHRRQLSRIAFLAPDLQLAILHGAIIAGHARVEAAKMLAATSVPTIRLDHLTDPERRAYIIADNRLAELASWDEDVLGAELQSLAALDLDFELELTGFDGAELDRLLGVDVATGIDPEADQIPEPEGSPVSRPGDLWALGKHNLLCGDARDPSAYALLMAGDQARVVFTDPPYNVRVVGNVGGKGKTARREFAMASGEMTPADFTIFLTQSAEAMAEASLDGSIHYVCMDWRHMSELLAAGATAYAELKNLVVWAKTNGGMGAFYRSQHELIFVFKKR
jgi:site-specific DNA recombinase